MVKKRFFYAFSIFLFIGMIFTTLSVKATNPEHFDLEYDDATNTLSVYVYHGVTYQTEHYIKYIEIQIGRLNDTDPHHLTLINGTIVATENFTSQADYNIIHRTYVFDATLGDDKTTGDAIQATAICNLKGEYTEFEYLFPRAAGHEFAFVSVVPAFIVGSLISGLFALLPLLIKKNRKSQLIKFKRGVKNRD